MTKFRTKLILMLMVVMFAFAAAGMVTACGSADYTVTFMVEETVGGSNWQTYAEAETEDGTVTTPTDPSKTYYTFRGWYTDTTFSTKFTNKDISSDTTVYAYFVPVEITLTVNGTAEGVKNLADLTALTAEYEADALANDLTFDGWYINSDYTTKYTSQDVDFIYGRYMAEVVFNNGYEDVYVTNVTAGTRVAQPSADDIVKYYMSEEDIFFVNSETYEDYDFSSPVNANTTITIQWKTPGLKYVYNTKSGNYYIYGVDRSSDEVQEAVNNGEITSAGFFWDRFPVISFPSRATIDGTLYYIDSFYYLGSIDGYFDGAFKIIFQEGIENIVDFYSTGTNENIEEIVIPSTVKVIENSFNFFVGLQSITVPDGVEVIIDSFWKTKNPNNSNYSYGGIESDGYDFTIEIPASVINLSIVPSNLTFAEGSDFYMSASGNALYKDDDGKKLLIMQYDITDDGIITVEEGVQGIQVGAFCNTYTLTYIYLPSTFSYIGYNEYADSYDTYYNVGGGGALYNSTVKDSEYTSSMSTWAYSIFNDLKKSRNENFGKIIMYTASYPEGVSDYAINGAYNKPWNCGDYENMVIFIGERTAEGEAVTVYVTLTNTMTDETTTVSLDTYKSGDTLTETDFITGIGLSGTNIGVYTITEFGVDYEFPSTLTRNAYIDVTYGYAVTGITVELNSARTGWIVTGFDQSTAQELSSGYYLVNIPDTLEAVSAGATYTLPVVEIAENAFKGQQSVQMVMLSDNVTKIGNAAFQNCVNLSSIKISENNALTYIGDSAFDQCSMETISFTLANITYIGPYAFKMRSLLSFQLYDDTDRVITNITVDSPVGYYYRNRASGATSNIHYTYQIVYWAGETAVEQQPTYETYQGNSDEYVDVLVYEVQLVASAGGFNVSGNFFSLGVSKRGTSGYEPNPYGDFEYAYRYEIMEGSVYYLDNISSSYGILFGCVSTIHENAFTDISESISMYVYYYRRDTVNTYGYRNYDRWLDLQDIQNMSSDIFEEGWWNGLKSTDDGYSALQARMLTASYVMYTNTY